MSDHSKRSSLKRFQSRKLEDWCEANAQRLADQGLSRPEAAALASRELAPVLDEPLAFTSSNIITAYRALGRDWHRTHTKPAQASSLPLFAALVEAMMVMHDEIRRLADNTGFQTTHEFDTLPDKFHKIFHPGPGPAPLYEGDREETPEPADTPDPEQQDIKPAPPTPPVPNPPGSLAPLETHA